MTRRIVSWDEQDAYTGWRRFTRWRGDQLERIKRRTHHRERREAKVEISSQMPRPFDPSVDCRHGCNGDCYKSGSLECDFTCHDSRYGGFYDDL